MEMVTKPILLPTQQILVIRIITEHNLLTKTYTLVIKNQLGHQKANWLPKWWPNPRNLTKMMTKTETRSNLMTKWWPKNDFGDQKHFGDQKYRFGDHFDDQNLISWWPKPSFGNRNQLLVTKFWSPFEHIPFRIPLSNVFATLATALVTEDLWGRSRRPLALRGTFCILPGCVEGSIW